MIFPWMFIKKKKYKKLNTYKSTFFRLRSFLAETLLFVKILIKFSYFFLFWLWAILATIIMDDLTLRLFSRNGLVINKFHETFIFRLPFCHFILPIRNCICHFLYLLIWVDEKFGIICFFPEFFHNGLFVLYRICIFTIGFTILSKTDLATLSQFKFNEVLLWYIQFGRRTYFFTFIFAFI